MIKQLQPEVQPTILQKLTTSNIKFVKMKLESVLYLIINHLGDLQVPSDIALIAITEALTGAEAVTPGNLMAQSQWQTLCCFPNIYRNMLHKEKKLR